MHHPDVVIRPDRRLAFLALAKFAGIGAMIGFAIVVLVGVDPEVAFPLGDALLIPVMLGVMGASTLGLCVAVAWWSLPGQVTYTVAEGLLTSSRGRWIRKQIPLERVASVDFDRHVRWTHLVFTHWFSYDSPIPTLSVTLTRTSDRWDPTNDAVVELPRILLSGQRQTAALRELRRVLGLPVEERVAVSAPNG